MERNNNFVCFFKRGVALFLGVFLLLNMPACTMEATNIPYDTPREWTPVYNLHEHDFFISRSIPIAFHEDLSEEDLKEILPDKPLPFEVYSAIAAFQEDGSVYSVELGIGSENGDMCVFFSRDTTLYSCCMIMNKGKYKSCCGDLEYTLYDSNGDLMAETEILGTSMFARTYGSMSKQDFEAILECFSWYSIGKPKIYTIRPREH